MMRILIAAAGSRGDVAPYTGLGVALRGAGYEVALATTEAFAPLVRQAGLEFPRPPPPPPAGGGGRGPPGANATPGAGPPPPGGGVAA
ncbi:glycosyltransferase, partial [Streptomyces sp. NPDC059783]|uniref:glycosyltransferase n=1 Tax=Streptomyces sp. NPDC059783 TaxID=3346944 RepID=UPI00366232A3